MPPTLPFHPGAPRRASSLGGTTNPLARSSSRAAARAPELDALIQPAKEQALTEALTRLGAGRDVTRPYDASLDLAGNHVLDEEYRVSADGVITAVRRLPPVEARYEPFPDPPSASTRGCDAALERGIDQLYSHQADAFAAAPPAATSSSSRRPPAARRSVTTCRS